LHPRVAVELVTGCYQPLHAPSNVRTTSRDGRYRLPASHGLLLQPHRCSTRQTCCFHQHYPQFYVSALEKRRKQRCVRERAGCLGPTGWTDVCRHIKAATGEGRRRLSGHCASKYRLMPLVTAVAYVVRLTRLSALSSRTGPRCPAAPDEAFDPISLVAANRNASLLDAL